MTIAICFGQFGPYHHARVAALQHAAVEQRVRVIPVQIASDTATYEWKEDDESRVKGRKCDSLKTLCEGVEEAASPLDVFLKARRLFRGEKVDVAFLPSYSPARYFALFAAAKSLGIRTVMMNESHAGTEQATGWKRWIKRQIVKRFDAAFVGGEPHKRHFASLGIPAEKIFTGYDAVDGDFFAQRADEIRAAQRRSSQSSVGSSQTEQQSVRSAYGLPERYFLSLGRMVEKKNLATLVSAYAKFCDEWLVAGDEREKKAPPALVFVGSGELENALREQAWALGLRVVDRTGWGPREEGKTGHGLTQIDADKSELLSADRTGGDASCRVIAYGPSTAAPPVAAVGGSLQKETEDCKPTAESSRRASQRPTDTDDSGEQRGAVFFYGFRQIEENAVFYALAEAFVLPSLKEEWGLVVNEAMAAGLPVIVSRTAGCAEDLLPEATASRSSPLAVGSKQPSVSNANENMLEERSNGFVFDPTSADALATALRRVGELEQRRLEMGKRSREIVAKFSCENFAKQAMRAAEAASA